MTMMKHSVKFLSTVFLVVLVNICHNSTLICVKASFQDWVALRAIQKVRHPGWRGEVTQGGGSDVSYSKFEKKTSKCEMGEGVEKCYFVSDVHFECCLTSTSPDKTEII